MKSIVFEIEFFDMTMKQFIDVQNSINMYKHSGEWFSQWEKNGFGTTCALVFTPSESICRTFFVYCACGFGVERAQSKAHQCTPNSVHLHRSLQPNR